LIPRPETEIDLAVASAKNSWATQLEQGDWADLGTGSGAIALDLQTPLRRRGFTPLIAARWQARSRLRMPNSWDLQTGFTFIRFLVEPLESLRQVSGMVANPPHIPSTLVPQLQPEVAP